LKTFSQYEVLEERADTQMRHIEDDNMMPKEWCFLAESEQTNDKKPFKSEILIMLSLLPGRIDPSEFVNEVESVSNVLSIKNSMLVIKTLQFISSSLFSLARVCKIITTNIDWT